MLDTYILGKVSRISPESPVPVVCPQQINHYLGGAANVARNAVSLGANVAVVFAFGMDSYGDSIISKLQEWGVSCDYVLRSPKLLTMNKVRILGNRQQIVRVDYNDVNQITKEIQSELYPKIIAAIHEADIIIISDYGKGLCTSEICQMVIETAGEKPVLIDPKGTQWEKYRGASIITPNLKEINTYSGWDIPNSSEDIMNAYGDYCKKLGIDYVLLTRSEKGMSLIGENTLNHIPVSSHEVFDVSGAGDTALATLAAYLKTDMSNVLEAARISNIAAGIVVGKLGTSVVTKSEIDHQMNQEQNRERLSKVFDDNDYYRLEEVLNLWRTAGNSIVVANGCFDLLHRGHIKLLEQAKACGDKLIVAINADNSVKRLKGNDRPINKERDRAYVIAAIEFVDAVVIFDPQKRPVKLTNEETSQMSEKAIKGMDEAPMGLMKMIRPDVQVKGGDYHREDIPESIYAKDVFIVSTEEGYSTTNMIKKINE